jgi:hypothetical protein
MDRWSWLDNGPLVLADPIHIGKDVESYDEPTVANTMPLSRVTRPMSTPGDVPWATAASGKQTGNPRREGTSRRRDERDQCANQRTRHGDAIGDESEAGSGQSRLIEVNG